MIYTILPQNSVIGYMKYSNEKLIIGFKKAKGVIQERSYNVNMLLAYRLFYSKTAAECLKTFNEIKKLCPVINVQVL
jgi:hypothetical protein